MIEELTPTKKIPLVYVGLAGTLVVLILIGGFVGWTLYSRATPDNNKDSTKTTAGVLVPPVPLSPLHIEIPAEVRGIYWTGGTAGTKHADELLDYMVSSGLNTVVIDLKMDNGVLDFVPRDSKLNPYVAEQPTIKDLDGLLARLAEYKIYRIARIAVMRDGAFASVHPEVAMKTKGGGLWYDNIGSVWVDPAAPSVAEYALDLAHEAYNRGFDEVQFDYVRFASDGKTNAIVYPVYDGKEEKEIVMQRFFSRVGDTLKSENIPVSFDLFGITFWSTSDYNIGQRLVDVYPHADYISPMVYPSHYPNGFKGYANPALYPYEVIKMTLEAGVEMLNKENLGIPDQSKPKVRPWIQDFDMGAVYDAAKIEAQIKAARDAGASGWLIWNARNVYEPAEYTIISQ